MTVERVQRERVYIDWVGNQPELLTDPAPDYRDAMLRKTHLSNAFCISALRQLKTVRYIRANTLMLELEQARLKSTYSGLWRGLLLQIK